MYIISENEQRKYSVAVISLFRYVMEGGKARRAATPLDLASRLLAILVYQHYVH